MIITLIKAVIIGIIEGVTEWLPISSTGHMILAEQFLSLEISDTFYEFFLVAIQLGAVMSVAVLYFNKLVPQGILKKTEVRQDAFSLWLKIIIACLPAAFIGLMLDDKINDLFFNYQTVAATLIFYGLIFIFCKFPQSNTQITFKTALIIGLFQLLSLIPGTSRSGATIIGAMLVGVSKTDAAEFTFLLAIPVMLGASLLKLVKLGFNFSAAELAVLAAGSLTAFIVSVFAIKFLIGYVKNHDFKAFGIYRVALGAAVLTYFAIEPIL